MLRSIFFYEEFFLFFSSDRIPSLANVKEIDGSNDPETGIELIFTALFRDEFGKDVRFPIFGELL